MSELLAVHSELSKAKQGSYLLRRLDVDGYVVGYFLYCGISISIFYFPLNNFDPLVSK